MNIENKIWMITLISLIGIITIWTFTLSYILGVLHSITGMAVIDPDCNNNTICDGNETYSNCPSDCTEINYCNNNTVCETNETIENCPSDCQIYCGDGIISAPDEECDPIATFNCGDYEICSADCNCELLVFCGNNNCDENETYINCSDDCELILGCNNNTICDWNETIENCPSDCIEINYCNNNTVCETNETTINCPSDCECLPGDSRYYGSDVGYCEEGFQICDTFFKWNTTVSAVLPINETCNNIDDNCDGVKDEGFDWNDNSIIDSDEAFDYDEDGYYPTATIYYNLTCTGFSEYDCNDTNSSIHPNAQEEPNNIDDNCDGIIENMTEISTAIEKVNLGVLTTEGNIANLRKGDWAVFRIKNISVKLELINISENSVVAEIFTFGLIASTLPEFTINLNEIKEFDIDIDGEKDISIMLNNIQFNFKAVLEIKDISEFFAPPACNNNKLCESWETKENCPNDCAIIYCNNNAICESKETIEGCPDDCKVIEEKQIKMEDIVGDKKEWECNNNGFCESWETKENCPTDCTVSYFKYIVPFFAIFTLISLTSGGIVIRLKKNPYRIKKDLKQEIIRIIHSGYNINNIGYYLTCKNIKKSPFKKALRYASDFITLKRAIALHLVQGKNEDSIRKQCIENKWSKKIINDVFEDIFPRHKDARIIRPNYPIKTNTQNFTYQNNFIRRQK